MEKTISHKSNFGVRGWRAEDHGPIPELHEIQVIGKQAVTKKEKRRLVATREETIKEHRLAMKKVLAFDIEHKKEVELETLPDISNEGFLSWVKEQGGIVVGSWPKARIGEAVIVFPNRTAPKDRVKSVGVMSEFVREVVRKFYVGVDIAKVNNHSCVIDVNGISVTVLESNFDKLNGTTHLGRGYGPLKEKSRPQSVAGVNGILVYSG